MRISQAPIEAIIAGTIDLLASENLRDSKVLMMRNLILVVFSFGLLHGLGFAGALKEIGLPQSNQFSALFLFNIGLELAQLTLVVPILLLLLIINRMENKLLLGFRRYFCFE